MRRMARDRDLRWALRRLDHLPAAPALAIGAGAGAALGWLCLRPARPLDAVGMGLFVALVIAALPLAASARPVAVPLGEATWLDRLKRAPLALRIATAAAPLLLVCAWIVFAPSKTPTPLPELPPSTAEIPVPPLEGPVQTATATASDEAKQPPATTPPPPPRALAPTAQPVHVAVRQPPKDPKPVLTASADAGGPCLYGLTPEGECRSKPANEPAPPKGLPNDEVQAFVSKRIGDLKVICWKAFAGFSPKSVQMSATIVINPSGAIDSVKTSGGEKLPGLGPCVEDVIRKWTFRKAEAPTPAHFNFELSQ
jgi:hypothetical protein